MPNAVVVVPRDSWSALALALLAAGASAAPPGGAKGQDSASHVCGASPCVADYACTELVAERTIVHGAQGRPRVMKPRRQRRRRPCVVRLGETRAVDGGAVVYVALPSLAQLFYDGTRRWADYAQWETARVYAAWCRIATVQTIGGGWASLRRADKALVCAMELFELAQIVQDGDIASKCRLFVGWAHLWSGHHDVARHLFALELKDALMRGDVVHQRRCENAIINATTNPTLNGSQGPASAQFTLTDCWTRAFSGVDVVGEQISP